MRLLITFRPERKYFLLPVNYNYELSSLIYNIMSMGGPNFASWLHQRGFQLEGKKRFKMFNFSRLFFSEKQIEGELVKAKGNFRLIFSTPIDESIMTNFVSGILEANDWFYLGNKDIGTRLKIASIKILPFPKFNKKQKYIMLSPTVASIQDKNKKVVYLSPLDELVIDVLRKNIVNKYETLFQKKCPYEINIKFDESYIQSNIENGNIMKLIKIKSNEVNSARIKGFMVPLTIDSSNEIHKLVYESGLGEKNSLGFGMLEIARL